MKLWFDCLLTAPSPKQCSTTMQFRKIADLMFAKRDDVYIYWAIPKGLPEKARAEYDEDPRITYVEIEQNWRDRNVEYMRLPAEYSRFLRVDGPYWDWDIMVTVRTPMIPSIRAVSGSYRHSHLSRKRKIICIEDMMVSTKKPTVAMGDPVAQDIMTITGYLAADVVLCPAYHQKSMALDMAREHLSAYHVRALREKFKEVSHLQFGDYPDTALKTKFKYDSKGERRMNLAFIGRLERFGLRLDDMNKLLGGSFILREDKIRPIVCTITQGDTHIDTDAIEVLHPKQQEFWRLCKEEIDLCLAFSIDVELNMSKLEPTMFGVPTLVIRAPWSEAMFGADYPFMVKGNTEAFAWITKFQEDYEGCYKLFADWWEDWFIPTYEKREKEDGMYEHIITEILNYYEGLEKLLPASYENNGFVRDIAEAIPVGEVTTLEAVVEALVKAKKMDAVMLAKLHNGCDRFNLTFTTDWHYTRIGLQMYHNVVDAGAGVGTILKTA